MTDGGFVRMFPSEPKAAPSLVSYEAEQNLLGAILTNNRALERLPLDFRAFHFGDPLHGRIFDVLRETIDRGHAATPITLKRTFEGETASGSLTVGQYMVKLSSAVVAMVNAEEWARTIMDLWARRSVVKTCREIISETTSADPEREGVRVIEDAEAKIHALTEGDKAGKKGLTLIGEGVDATLEQIEMARKAGGVSGLSTGLIDLDRRTAGLHPGQLVIVGARPGMGKSDFALNLSYNAAIKGRKIGFFSLEMSADLLTNRILARVTGIPATLQIGGGVQTEDMGRLVGAAGTIRDLPLWIDDSPASSIDVIASRARRLQRRRGLDLLVIDYLQLISPGNNRQNRETNRTTDVTMISQGLKALAKDLSVPVVSLCQLSRAVESRQDKRPQLADLRESGSIEQDADVVIFLYRDSYYLERDTPKQRLNETAEAFSERRDTYERDLFKAMNICEAIIAKQRMGAPGAVSLYYKPAHSHFDTLDQRGHA